MAQQEYSSEMMRYMTLLAEKYPTERSVTREIINLNAILNLPKGTEHFMSDLHGEYEAFCHILNNCSGVVREKVELSLGGSLRSRACSRQNIRVPRSGRLCPRTMPI